MYSAFSCCAVQTRDQCVVDFVMWSQTRMVFEQEKSKFASFSFVNLSLFEIISTYPEDQFANHLLLRHLGCFYHQREKAGKIGHPENQFWKVVFDKEKPWNEEVKLHFCQRKLHLSSHWVGRVWIPVRAASKQPKKLLRLQLQPLRLSTIHNYHTSNKIITHSTFIDNYRTSKTIITLS